MYASWFSRTINDRVEAEATREAAADAELASIMREIAVA